MLKYISDVHQVDMVIAGGINTFFKNQDSMYMCVGGFGGEVLPL